jgi:phosphohistidine phosphatase
LIRRLILMRHAKSAWNTNANGDHDRPLNPRGRRDAPRMGGLIVGQGFTPAQVFSSDSSRTRETWDGMWAAMPELDPVFTRRLYLSGIDDIAEIVASVDDACDSVLLLGHNPGFSMAAGWLTGEAIELKTAHAAVMEADIDRWTKAFLPGSWRLIALLTPKD